MYTDTRCVVHIQFCTSPHLHIVLLLSYEYVLSHVYVTLNGDPHSVAGGSCYVPYMQRQVQLAIGFASFTRTEDAIACVDAINHAVHHVIAPITIRDRNFVCVYIPHLLYECLIYIPRCI